MQIAFTLNDERRSLDVAPETAPGADSPTNGMPGNGVDETRPAPVTTVDGPDGPIEQRRQYSISAPAGQRPRVGVREIPDGLFSRWLVREVRPGDEIEVQPPSGRFCPAPALCQ